MDFCKIMPSPEELLKWGDEQRLFHSKLARLSKEHRLFELAKAYTGDLLRAYAVKSNSMADGDRSRTQHSQSSRSASLDCIEDARREDDLARSMLKRDYIAFSLRIHSRMLFGLIGADVNQPGRVKEELDPTGEPLELVQLLAVVELGIQEDRGITQLRLVYWTDKDDILSEFYERAEKCLDSALYTASLRPSRAMIAEVALRLHAGVGVLLNLKLLDPASDPGQVAEIYANHKAKILTYYATAQRG